MLNQATKLKPPRPFSRGQVAALSDAMFVVIAKRQADGELRFIDAIDVHTIMDINTDAIRLVNDQARGVSS